MKSKDLLELKKLKQEIALIREAKNHIAHNLEWYRQSAESIEKHYQLLTAQLNWNEKKMKEAEKKIEEIVNCYEMAGCNYSMCHEINFKKEMKYVEFDSEKLKRDEYFCNTEHYEEQELFRKQYPNR